MIACRCDAIHCLHDKICGTVNLDSCGEKFYRSGQETCFNDYSHEGKKVSQCRLATVPSDPASRVGPLESKMKSRFRSHPSERKNVIRFESRSLEKQEVTLAGSSAPLKPPHLLEVIHNSEGDHPLGGVLTQKVKLLETFSNCLRNLPPIFPSLQGQQSLSASARNLVPHASSRDV
jgi:hypothetical protein